MKKWPSKYQFAKTEKSLNWQKKLVNKGEKFFGSLLMPPPNITGNLHLGHCLNLSLQDFLVRYSYLCGQPIYWLAGIDHAGIATQKKVESLKLPFLQTSQAKKAYTLKVWYPQNRKIFLAQWKKMGLLVDQKAKFTLEKSSQRQVKKAFVKLYQDGLLYRAKRLINWDPQLETAVSDIEVERQPKKAQLYYLKYPLLDSSEYLVVATSRPETIFADVALFFHPQDPRYRRYQGQKAQHPVNQKILPILAEKKILPDFGTGVCKCTPGHDFLDYQLGQKHDLPLLSCCDEKGILNSLAGEWQGRKIQTIRQELVEKLTQQGICLKTESYQTTLPISQRSGAVIEPILSTQWFCDLPKLISKLEAKNPAFLKSIDFYPSRFSSVINKWKKATHQWCLSRQLWWGHPIPAWFRSETGRIRVSLKKPIGSEWQAERDVLDTWFSSSLWPLITTSQGSLLSINSPSFPFSHLVTGYDILFFWVLKMILLSYYFTGQLPFKKVYLHGLVRDSQGQKMSKSLGNVIEPSAISEKYGADSLRLFLLENNVLGADLVYQESKVRSAYHFLQKIWSIANFIQGKITPKNRKKVVFLVLKKRLNQEKNSTIKLVSTWILTELKKLKKDYFRHSSQLQTKLLTEKLTSFTWEKFSNNYLELVKLLPWNLTSQKTLLYIYQQILLLFNPLIPFITHYLYPQFSGEKSLTKLEVESFSSREAQTVWVVDFLLVLRKSLSSFRQKEKISTKLEVYCQLIKAEQSKELTSLAGEQFLASLNCEIYWTSFPLNQSQFFHFIDLYPFATLQIVQSETNLYQKLLYLEAEYQRAQNLLANPNFCKKAPSSLVAQERKKLAYFAKEKTKLTQFLKKTII